MVRIVQLVLLVHSVHNVQLSGVKRLPVSEARRVFPDLVHEAFYAGQITVLTRRGKGDVAAIAPVRLVNMKPNPAEPLDLGRSRDRKPPVSVARKKSSEK